MRIEAYITITAVAGTGVPGGLSLSRFLRTVRDGRVGEYGISFPDAEEGRSTRAKNSGPSTGNRVHFFGSTETVGKIHDLVTGFSDYISATTPAPITPASHPEHVRCVRARGSKRTSATIQRELRRSIARAAAGKRKPVTDSEVEERLKSGREGFLPFISVHSHSTKQSFCVAFKTSPCDAHQDGEFDSFGFSKGRATVPLIR